MPKLEPKAIQKELDQGWLWPVYWMYGPERMKSRELFKRIRRAALGLSEDGADDPGASTALFGEEILEGSEISAAAVVDSARSPSLGGGVRLIVVRDAHALKAPEELAALLGPRVKREQLLREGYVCVFFARELDGRRKFSKTLTERAAVVPCEEVVEADRGAWIQYLAKRRGVAVSPAGILGLSTLEPWTLDIVDQELQKLELATATDGANEDALLHGGVGLGGGGADAFLDAFFSRRLGDALAAAATFADQPDEALPLLGLLGWNARQLDSELADRAARTRVTKLNPYVAERIRAWCQGWSRADALDLHRALSELDFGIKQTPLLPLGLWTELITRFCR